MHPNNRYGRPHDFAELARLEPQLKPYLLSTPDGRTSLDFASDRAVYLLNRVLLRRDYKLQHWDIPPQNLTPPLPGRLDYLLHLNDLHPPTRRVLDIGCGASVIYPILGVGEFGWSFVGSEVDPRSTRVAQAIVQFNPALRRSVTIRGQSDPSRLFAGIVREGERFDLSMCNPPFFADREEALRASRKKWKKLGYADRGLTFGGVDGELWTSGGEAGFLRRMIDESAAYAHQFAWFTTLVSRKGYLRAARQQLEALGATTTKTINMGQGNKRSRILAWRY